MDAERIALAQRCLDAAHDGSMGFPAIIATLMGAGFEGYEVNYRTGTQTYYLANSDNVTLRSHPSPALVNGAFDAARVATLVRWAQSGDADYNYSAFSEQAKRAGCAGYLVSMLGRRVLYYGRTGETHVEIFPR